MRPAMRLTALAFLAPLFGCVSGGHVISHVTYNGYDPSYVADAASNGPLPVHVFGAPAAGVDADTAAARIGDAMEGANLGQQFAYTAYSTPPENGYVLVVRFGGGTPPGRLCRDDVEGGVGLNFGMAFCKDGHALSYLAGVAATADIASPAFRDGMAVAAIEMFPPKNPEVDCEFAIDCD